MPITATPGHLAHRAEFYFELAQLTSAGVGIVGALKHLLSHRGARRDRWALQLVLEHLSAGATLSESLRMVPGWLAELDLALIGAGELSGRLDSSFRTLAEYYGERARLARQFLADLAYPVFLFHFAIFLLPFAAFFTSGDLLTYLKSTIGVLLPCYAVIALVVYAGQGTRGENWRAIWEALLDRVPVLGAARRELMLSRLASALEALLSAGVSIVQAWSLAAAASGSPALKRVVASWQSPLASGETPSDLVNNCGLFPPLFAGHYATGELSGTLEEQLKRLQKFYADSAMRTLQNLSAWLPRVFYIGVVLVIAWRVLRFWGGYFQGIGNALGG